MKVEFKQITLNSAIKYGVIFGLLIFVAFMPEKWLNDEHYSVCLHKSLLGFQCPLCGMTRAVNSIAHFRIHEALSLNFAVVFLPVYLLLDIISFTRATIFIKRVKIFVLILFVISLALLYIIRLSTFLGWMSNLK